MSFKIDYTKPILKWVGGKTQIIDSVLNEFPKEMNNYHEIFLGGGSVLFALLDKVENGNIKINGLINAYDLNKTLIYVYKNIQNNPLGLYNELQLIINTYISITGTHVERDSKTLEEAMTSQESYYYYIRYLFNNLTIEEKESIKASALFIFLNKTCFRGLYRVGPKGFNVPFGNYKNPEIINKEHLLKVHHLIQNVNFICSDFNDSLNKIEKEDFIYLDPPYAPETSNSFVKYTDNGFSLEQHAKLFTKCVQLINKPDFHIQLLLSNADVKLVREMFDSDNFVIKPIECKRRINSKNPDSKTIELLIKSVIF